MKGCITVLVIVLISLGQTLEHKNVSSKMEEQIAQLLIANYQQIITNNGAYTSITTVMNDFIDQIFANLEIFAWEHKLEPLNIINVTEDFKLASFKLTNGSLQGIFTVQRYQNVVASYEHATKEFCLVLPIKFNDLRFKYDYEIHIIGLGPKGQIIGEINEFKFYLEFCFDVPKFVVSIKNLKTTDSGHISVQTVGNETDFIFNIISEFVTTILHPFLQGVIEGIIKVEANYVVQGINNALYTITHPNSTYLLQLSQHLFK